METDEQNFRMAAATDTASRQLADNPFSTSMIRPGAIPYLFPTGETIEQLISRLDQVEWRGQIVGPHGSGKSTLIAALIPFARIRFEVIDWWSIHRRRSLFGAVDWRREKPQHHQVLAETKLPDEMGPSKEFRPLTKRLNIVEGWENLFFWHRWASRLFGVLSERYVLISGHRPLLGWGQVIYRTHIDAARFVQVCRYLQRNEPRPLDESAICAVFQDCGGNAREALLTLYDLHQKRDTQKKGTPIN